MTTKLSILFASILAVSHCGLATAADTHEEEHGHKHAFAKDIDAFHAVLAPLWHAPIGKVRSENACAQAPSLANLAKNIGSADSKALQASIATLQEQCKANSGDVDAVFASVHDAFHQIAKH